MRMQSYRQRCLQVGKGERAVVLGERLRCIPPIAEDVDRLGFACTYVVSNRGQDPKAFILEEGEVELAQSLKPSFL